MHSQGPDRKVIQATPIEAMRCPPRGAPAFRADWQAGRNRICDPDMASGLAARAVVSGARAGLESLERMATARTATAFLAFRQKKTTGQALDGRLRAGAALDC